MLIFSCSSALAFVAGFLFLKEDGTGDGGSAILDGDFIGDRMFDERSDRACVDFDGEFVPDAIV